MAAELEAQTWRQSCGRPRRSRERLLCAAALPIGSRIGRGAAYAAGLIRRYNECGNAQTADVFGYVSAYGPDDREAVAAFTFGNP